MIGNLHAQDRRATGAPVYNGASNAATIGTVDPTGYVEREQRSGLAKQLRARWQPAGQDPAQLVGETASRADPKVLARMLAARMGQQRGR